MVLSQWKRKFFPVFFSIISYLHFNVFTDLCTIRANKIEFPYCGTAIFYKSTVQWKWVYLTHNLPFNVHLKGHTQIYRKTRGANIFFHVKYCSFSFGLELESEPNRIEANYILENDVVTIFVLGLAVWTDWYHFKKASQY